MFLADPISLAYVARQLLPSHGCPQKQNDPATRAERSTPLKWGYRAGKSHAHEPLFQNIQPRGSGVVEPEKATPTGRFSGKKKSRRIERDPAPPFLDVTLVPHHSSKRWINTLLDCADISRTLGARADSRKGIG